MVAKVLLHIRTGQSGHVYDIFVSLFDIISDPGILGISKAALQKPVKWKRPELFGYKEDYVLCWFKQGIFEELQVRQLLFWLVQNSYQCVKTDKTCQWLETMLKFWYKFIRDASLTFSQNLA